MSDEHLENIQDNELSKSNTVIGSKIHEIVLNARMNQINHINQLDQIIKVIKKDKSSIRIRQEPTPIIEENLIRTYLPEPYETENMLCSNKCKFILLLISILWGVGLLYFFIHL